MPGSFYEDQPSRNPLSGQNIDQNRFFRVATALGFVQLEGYKTQQLQASRWSRDTRKKVGSGSIRSV
jgi:hypothetical protein